MKKIIYLDSGHSLTDPGTESAYAKETDLNREIRNALIPELQRSGFEVRAVPDEFNLAESIAWVNEQANNLGDGLALAIHNNCCGRKGAETYYYGNNLRSKEIAKKLIDEFCLETGMVKIGERSDTLGRFGYLGWIRNTNCWATLIECGFVDNFADVEFIKNNYKKVARGIAKGVCAIFDTPYIPETENPQPEAKTKAEIKSEIKKLIDLL